MNIPSELRTLDMNIEDKMDLIKDLLAAHANMLRDGSLECSRDTKADLWEISMAIYHGSYWTAGYRNRLYRTLHRRRDYKSLWKRLEPFVKVVNKRPTGRASHMEIYLVNPIAYQIYTSRGLTAAEWLK